MTDAGFFKGTNTEQDSRFADKKKKLLKSMKFEENLSEKVDTTRIKVDSIKPWIVKRITELLSFDDDIVCDFVVNMLAEQSPDPKEIQINLSAFLGSKNARIFVGELWDLLLSAMNTPGGVPAILLEAKKAEILSARAQEEKFKSEQQSSRQAAGSHGDGPSSNRSDGSASPARSDRRRRHYSSSPESPAGRSDRERRRRDEGRDRSEADDWSRRKRRHSRSPYDRHGSRGHHRRGHGRHHDHSPRDRRNHQGDDIRDRGRRDRSREEQEDRREQRPDGPICVPRDSSPSSQRETSPSRELVQNFPPLTADSQRNEKRRDIEVADGVVDRPRGEERSPVREEKYRRERDIAVYLEERRMREMDSDKRDRRHRSHRREDSYERRRDSGRVTMDNETYIEERRHRYEPSRNTTNHSSNLVELTEVIPDPHRHYERERSSYHHSSRHRHHGARKGGSGRGEDHYDRHHRHSSSPRRRSRSPEGPFPVEATVRSHRASPEGPELPRCLQEPDRSAKKSKYSEKKSKGGRPYSSDSSSSSTSSSDSASSSEYSSSESSGGSSSDSDSSSSGNSSSSSSENSDSSTSSSLSSSSSEKKRKRGHHGQNGKSSKKRKGHKGHHKRRHHKEKSIKKKAKVALKQMKVNKTKAVRKPEPVVIHEGPTLPPSAASQPIPSTSAGVAVEWKERREKSLTSSGSSSSSGTSSSDGSSFSTSSTDSEERERRERLKRKLFKSMPQGNVVLKEDSQLKRGVDGGKDADFENRSKRRRTDQDLPSSSGRAMKEGSRGESNVSDREGNAEEDRLRRRALESLRRKKAAAAGGAGSLDEGSERA